MLNYTNIKGLKLVFKLLAIVACIVCGNINAQNSGIYIAPNTKVSGLEHIYSLTTEATSLVAKNKTQVVYIGNTAKVYGLDKISNAKILKQKKPKAIKKEATKIVVTKKSKQKPSLENLSKNKVRSYPYKKSPFRGFVLGSSHYNALVLNIKKDVISKQNKDYSKYYATKNQLLVTTFLAQHTPNKNYSRSLLGVGENNILPHYSRPPPQSIPA